MFAFYFMVLVWTETQRGIQKGYRGRSQVLSWLLKNTQARILFSKPRSLFYLFYLLFSHNKDYTSITLYKDVARGPQKTTRLVRGGPLVTIILSNRTITTHNNGQYKTHYRYSRKSKTFVLNDCNVKIVKRKDVLRVWKSLIYQLLWKLSLSIGFTRPGQRRQYQCFRYLSSDLQDPAVKRVLLL